VQPLNNPSCSPAVLESSVLRTGTIGKMGAFAKFAVVAGNPGTQADEANVNVNATVTDVRLANNTDYTGRLLLTSALRLTDRQNGPAESGTVRDTVFNVPLNCAGTPADSSIGSTCTAGTSADALVPGTIIEGKRMIMSLLGVQVKDAGANGTGYSSCPPTCGDGDEKVFLRQGIFTP
jgi:hypothetical protein